MMPATAELTPSAQPTDKLPDAEDAIEIDEYVRWFEEAEFASMQARKGAEKARDYYDGKQLTAKELAALKKRNQPDIVINRIQPKINYLLGYEASNRSDPKAFPRTPQDDEAASAATDALRYVKDKTDLEMAFSATWENMLIEGYGGVELTVVEDGNGGKDFEIVKWDWDRLFYDPHSRKHDFSDARYLGGVVWMDKSDAEKQYPKNDGAFERTWNDRTSSQTYDDKPIHQQWSQKGKRQRIRIVQMYHNEGGQWMYCVFTKGGILDKFPVPFLDQDNKSWCPLILQSSFCDRDNNRYGLVTSMLGVQDEINKRRSKSLHRITMRQVHAERGAVEDVELAKVEMAKPDGWVETNPGFTFEVLDNSAQFQGEMHLMEHAQNEIEMMGPNASMQGQDNKAASGRAIALNQNSGQTSISILTDRLGNLKRRTYQRIWDLIRQYKDAEWWVRVTDDEKNVKFVGFNRPVTVAEDIQSKMAKQGLKPQDIQARMQQVQQQPGAAQIMQQVIRTENVPGQMYMDITIEQIPSIANVQQEQFDALIKLAPVVHFPPEVYLMASSLRNKTDLIDKIKSIGVDPVKAEFDKITAEQTIKKTEADIEQTRANAIKLLADANAASMPPGYQVNVPALVDGSEAQPQPQQSAPQPQQPMPDQPHPQMPAGPPDHEQAQPVYHDVPPSVPPPGLMGVS